MKHSKQPEAVATPHKHGFTLLELSIVLAIIGVVAAGVVALLGASLQSSQANQTVIRMNAIEQALVNFGVAYGRIPCPADLKIAAGATNYGVEAASNGTTCFGGTPSATSKWTGNSVEGAVPTRALKLPDSYMYDAWGRRFRYAVDPKYTAAGTLPVPSGGCTVASSSALTVKDATGASRSAAALYVLLSHGQKGHGGYSANGGSTMLNAGSTNADEQANCHCTSAAAASGTAAAYVQKAATIATAGDARTSFDDIVTYKEPWQIQTQSVPLAAPAACVYIGDTNNNRVQIFNTAGTFIMGIGSGYQGVGGTIGASGSTSGKFNSVSDVSADPTGNIWVSDGGNHRIQKFNPSGTFLLGIGSGYQGVGGSIGATGTSNGQFSYPSGMRVDASGNVWVGDSGTNCRVQEFNNSGTFLAKWGSCGSGASQFSGTMFMGIDPSDYVWVADQSNNRVQKFDGIGTLKATFTSGFSNVGAMTFDGPGDLWIADSSNNRVVELNPNGVYVTQIGTSGSGGGQFNYPAAAGFDAGGNLWVTDVNNHRIQKLDRSGSFISQFPCASGTCASGSASGLFNGAQAFVIH